MLYTEGEIVKSYKNAAKPSEQIEILAQLNCVDKKKIVEILLKHGISVKMRKEPAKKKEKESANAEGFKLFARFGQELQDRIEEIERLQEEHSRELESLRAELRELREYMNPAAGEKRETR